MIHIELMPIVIEAHHKYLQSLAAPAPEGLVVRTRRQAIGQLVIRIGRWLEGHRPAVDTEPALALGDLPERA